MKKILTTFGLFLVCYLSPAQTGNKISYYCSYYGDNAVLSSLEICFSMQTLPGLHKHDRAEGILNRIMGEVGLPTNFVLVECAGYNNCSAVNLEGLNGSLRYILYGDKFLKEIDSTSNTYWSSISIFAHEIGHHLSGHTLDMLGSRPDKELEADRFSGFIMFKLGATLQQAQAAMLTLGDPPYVSTHPPLANRLAAIRNGWNDGWQSNYRLGKMAPALPSLKNFDEIAIDLHDKAYLENVLNKPEEAIRFANTAISLKKNYADAYVQRGLAEANLGQSAKAIKTLDSALAINPRLTLAQVYKARAYNIAGLYILAEAEFQKAIQQNAGFAPIYAERAMMRNNQLRYDEAIADADKAISLKYKDIYIPFASTGFAYHQKNDLEAARRNFELSIRYNPTYDFAMYWLIKIKEKLEPAEKKPTNN